MMKHPFFIIISTLFLFNCQTSIENNSEESFEEDHAGFVPIFDGQSLNDWVGDSTYWRVENGMLIGEVLPSTLLKENSFIIWEGGKPSNFELKLEFRISDKGNSGINYRSNRLKNRPFALQGYQADLDGRNRYTGQNYEEKKRTTLAYRGEQVVVNPLNNDDSIHFKSQIENNAWLNREVVKSLGNADSLRGVMKDNKWNQYHLIVKDNEMKHLLNNVLMSYVVDNDTVNSTSSGLIGVQVHVGPPMKVEFRNIQLKSLN